MACCLQHNDIRTLIERAKLQSIEVAAINSPRSVTVVGNDSEIRRLVETARQAHIAARLLDIDYPFHSAQLEPAKDPILRALSKLRPGNCDIPLYSTVTGKILAGKQLDASYWWRNVREPVRFQDAIAAAAGDGCQVFIEISPRSILRNYITDCVSSDHDIEVVTTLDPMDDERSIDPVRAAVGRSIIAGAHFNTEATFGPFEPSNISLPLYPWQNKQFRMNPSPEALGTFSSSHVQHALLGARLRDEDLEWDRQLDTAVVPYLQDHRVGDRAIMPGTCYVEMALAAAAHHLKSTRVELRDVDFIQALELSAQSCQDVRTRLEVESSTVTISSRARLTTEERHTHMRARFGGIPSEIQPDLQPPARQTPATAPPVEEVYRLAARFNLHYGPAFQRVTACREIGSNLIEVELSAGENTSHNYILHPVDFDASLHGLNVIYKRLEFGESKLAYVPVRIGNLRVFEPGARIASARIKVGEYSKRGVIADFELFSHKGELVALAKEVRFKAASLVHRVRLGQTAYHVSKVVRAYPADSARGTATDIGGLSDHLRSIAPILDQPTRTSLRDNRLLADLAARRLAYDVASQFVGEDGWLDLTLHQDMVDGSAVDDAADEASLFTNEGDSAPQLGTNLLRVLEESGLAKRVQEAWRLEPKNPLPPLKDIVDNILADDPAWSAEATMLFNTASATHLPTPARARHSLATIEHFQCSAPIARTQIDAVVKSLQYVISRTHPAQPLRVLQLGVVGGGLTRELLPLLSDGHVNLVVADSDILQIGRVSSQWRDTPGLNIVVIDDELAQLRAFAHFDVVVSANGLSWLPRCDHILAKLPGLLTDHAIAIISERSPDSFHSVIFDGGVEEAAAATGNVRLRDATAWKKALALAGLTNVRDGHDDLVAPGTSFLVARCAVAAADEAGDNIANEEITACNRTTFIIDRGSKSKTTLNRHLVQTLSARGHGTIVSAPSMSATGRSAKIGDPKKSNGSSETIRYVAADAWSHLLQQIDKFSSNEIDIVYALNATPAAANRHSHALLTRVSELTALLQALGDHPVRLWVIAEGGARALVDLGEPCPVQAGVWAYCRTAINEFANLQLRLVDFDQRMSSKDKASRLASLVHEPSSLQELVLTNGGVSGLEIRRGLPKPAVGGGPSLITVDRPPAAIQLQQAQWGNLDGLTWTHGERRSPAEYEVEIEVVSAGLNFRDVMWVLGVLPEEALENGFAGPTIGLECAGRVVRVGSGVAGLSPGDEVIAIAPACFATHVTVAAFAVARLPSGIKIQNAASIPVAFLTACYALEQLARVDRDDWVLIHGAAGGVGLAAIQVAKRHGAHVIATAGSDEKRNFLRMFGVDYVFDSRSLDFVDRVREITKGGVDIVLNSLAGEAMERSLELLRPFGRFVELGKRDFYANTKVGLRPFRNNVSYFGVDADQLLTYEPDTAQRVFGSVIAGFESGAYSPLPCRTFRAEDVVEAFRLMQKSAHIGKIIVEAPAAASSEITSTKEFGACERGFHVVFGGTGGFGLEYARWLADHGARHVVLASRSGGANGEAQILADALRARDVSLERVACDVTDKRAVAGLLDRLRKVRPIVGVAHTAMVLDDGLIKSLTKGRIERVLAPKVQGARNLDLLTRHDPLDYFILFSSAAAMFGNPGQASYVAANGYLDGLARQRRAAGLKALAVAWGAITDVGVLARNKDTAKSLARHTGGVQFTARDGLDLLAQVLASERGDLPNIALAAMNWSLAKDVLPIMNSPAYDLIRRAVEARGEGGAGGVDLRTAVQNLDEAAAKKAVADYLIKEVSAIFRMSPEDINPKRSLTDIGMDSLMGLELRMAVESQIGIDIMKVSMSDGTTINDVAEHIARRLQDGVSDDEDMPAEQNTMIWQHVTEDIDASQLQQLGERVLARESDLQRLV